jgi:glucose/mannose-6-phosphate isomerase
MGMRGAIEAFNRQFAYDPVVENRDKLGHYSKFLVCGMGGSHLAADLLRMVDPTLDLIVHNDYGLPDVPHGTMNDRLVIASSYSGNTEEVISALVAAEEKNYPVATISIGGELYEMAKKHCLPYVQMSDTGIQPRSALGLSIKGLMALMGLNLQLKQISALTNSLDPNGLEARGKEIAENLKGCVPVVYSSRSNLPLSYNWKIKMNETGKIPCYYNIFPEINHNEMTGFDAQDSTRPLSKNVCFVFLKDEEDHLKVQKRMDVTKSLYIDRGFKAVDVDITGSTPFERMFNTLILGDWVALHTAENYGLESEQVPMVEEFKKLIA